MLRIPHSHAAAMVQRDPGGAAGRVQHGVQQRPVGNGVGAVLHAFRLAVRAGDGPRIEVVAADDDGRLQFARAHHLVEGQARDVALAQSQPADARRQALEGDALARHVQPVVHLRVVREQLLDLCIRFIDVFRVARQGHPAERPPSFAKLRADVSGYETGEVEGILHALVERHLADVVAVIDSMHAHGVEIEHGLHVGGAGIGGRHRQARVALRVLLRRLPVRHAPAAWQIAVDQVMRGGLVRHQVRQHAARLGAAHQFRQHFGRVAQQADGNGFLAFGVVFDQFKGFVQAGRLLVQVARAQAEVDAALLAFDIERHGARHGGGQRLRAAHAAQARRQNPAPAPVAAKVLAARFGEGFIRALHDALRADVDPAAGRHLAVHEQALPIEFVEVFPVGPFRHQVGVGDQYARRIRVGLEHAHRLAGLDQQGLVVFQFAQRGEDLVETGPVAGGAADAAVDDQVLRIFRHFRVQVVLQHAVGRLGLPTLASHDRAARGADGTAGIKAWIGVHCAVHAVSS